MTVFKLLTLTDSPRGNIQSQMGAIVRAASFPNQQCQASI